MDRQSNPDVVAGEGDPMMLDPIIRGVGLYSRSVVIKTAGIGTKQIHRPIEQKTGPRYKPHSYSCLLFFFTKCQKCALEERQSLSSTIELKQDLFCAQ